MTKTAKVLFVVIFGALISAFLFPPLVVLSLLAVIVLLVYLLIRRLTMPKEELKKIREENAARVAKWNSKAEQEQGRIEFEKMRAAEKKRKEDDRRAVSAVLITTNSKKSGVGRAVVGGALFGPVGAVAGAVTGSSKATKATFSVKYASGRTGTETVAIGGQRFNELSALLHK